MKRKDILELILQVGKEEAGGAEEILEALLKAGMLPVSKRWVTFSGDAIIYKFEEDITEKEWNRATEDKINEQRE